jgi:hypothetical protein
MKVSFATQLMSNTVAKGMKTYIQEKELPDDAYYTANLIEDIDTFFDIFNSSNTNCTKILNRPIEKNSDHWEYLEDIARKMKNVKFVTNAQKQLTKRQERPPCIDGILLNCESLKFIHNVLAEKFDVSYFCTRNACQDGLENLFCQIRSKNGPNEHPDYDKFLYAFRNVLCNNLICSKMTGNSENDDANFLINAQKNLERQPEKENRCITSYEKITIDRKELKIPDILELNAVTYICGATIKALCPECKRNLSTNEGFESSEIYRKATIFNNLKKYADSQNFIKPREKAIQIAVYIYSVFSSKFLELFYQSRNLVKTRLKILFPHEEFSTIICKKCHKIFLDKFFNTLINAFLKKNRIEIQRDKRRLIFERYQKNLSRTRKIKKLN